MRTLEGIFKALYIIGLATIFSSLFLEMYYFQIVEEGTILASFSYSLFFGWHTDILEYDFLTMYRPEVEIPFVITIIFLGLLSYCGYLLLRDSVEKQRNHLLIKQSYMLIFLLILDLFYIVAFPLFYLIPNGLYFPYLIFWDESLGWDFVYSVGPGYLLHTLGFLLTFTYAFHCWMISRKFKIQARSKKVLLEKKLKKIHAPLDLDALISEEKVGVRS